MDINYYCVRGGNGWERKMRCVAQEAIAQWKRVGGGARLYLVHPDGSETCIRPEPTPSCYDSIPDIPIAEERKEEYYYLRSLRSRWATPSF